MSRVDDYCEKLRVLSSWDSYLLKESNLPGPRANLELAFAVAKEGSEELFLEYVGVDPEGEDSNSQEVFLSVCGVIGLGYLAARGGSKHFNLLRDCASDPRWRIREAVALGLQKYGEAHFENLLEMMAQWSKGSLLERRAAIASLCEPKLLRDEKNACRVLDLLDFVTASTLDEKNKKSEDFQVLRKALGYAWSVVVAAQPDMGKQRMERWIPSNDRDIRWVMKHNLKKNRLIKMDSDWVKAQVQELSA